MLYIREQRQTPPQTKVDFSARFIPSPSKKAIWCFVYRESCHGELACKTSSTTGCIKLSNSCPKEPKNPRDLCCSTGTPHVKSTIHQEQKKACGESRRAVLPILHHEWHRRMAVGHQQQHCTAQLQQHMVSTNARIPSALALGPQSQIPADTLLSFTSPSPCPSRHKAYFHLLHQSLISL